MSSAMSSAPQPSPWPDHLLSLAEWDALPEDHSRRYELAEGILQVSPRPVSDHQWVVISLGGELMTQLRPAGFGVVSDTEVVLFSGFPPTVRAPDLMVVPTSVAKTNPARYERDEVVAAVEIISPGSRRTDRVTKFSEYVEAGIPNYWIVDLEPPATISVFELVGAEYKLVVETSTTLSVTVPVPLTVDVRALLP
jgi:Uma2 family endonuclease